MYRPTIGLEIHAELATNTKMFCACLNNADETEPNVNICPICLAHPGTLPVPNYDAIEKVLRVGTALKSTLADFTEFDRKSYFYPDIPKGYQISQFEHPLVKGGTLAGISITRIHLEEDTARSSHVGEDATSLVDFNRAGVPLMELVTEPVIHDSLTAGNFARELQLLLRTLGASDANLEKGEMRIEANVSVSNTDTPSVAYVEIKNINSFRSVERAIEFEIARQTKLLEEGGTLVKETRGWDENKQQTFSQRIKEGAADYRYFPEPDIPKILRSEIKEWSDEQLRAALPELPLERRARYMAFGIKEEDATFIGATLSRGIFFDALIHIFESDSTLILLAVNYFVSDLAGLEAKNELVSEDFVTPELFAELIRMIEANALSSRGAKDVLAKMYVEGGSPKDIALREGLIQVSDTGALTEIVKGILSANPDAVKEYKAGKESMLQFFVGQAMKVTRGAGNPGLLKEIILAELGDK